MVKATLIRKLVYVFITTGTILFLASCFKPLQQAYIMNTEDPVCSSNILNGLNYIMEKKGIKNPDLYITGGFVSSLGYLPSGQAAGLEAFQDGVTKRFYFSIGEIRGEKNLILVRLEKIKGAMTTFNSKPTRKGIMAFPLSGCK